MRFSVKIARLFGIDIRIHLLFLLVLLLPFQSRAEVADAALRYGGLFTFVLLHELGHSLVARRLGVRVLDITLWPLGGLARLANVPESPRTELAITVAGPLVNFALASVFVVALFAIGAPVDPLRVPTLDSPLLVSYLSMNLWMGLFNLVPAFPLDGGRILRALLATRTSWLRATERAVWVGRVLALAALVWGLLATPTEWVLVLVAWFVWTSGMAELASVRWREATRRAFDGFGFANEEDVRDAAAKPTDDASPFPEMSAERRAALDEALERLRRERGARGSNDVPSEGVGPR